MKENFYVYIMANREYGTIYVGVTSDLRKRVYEHKNEIIEGFTSKYHLHKLVYYEVHDSAESAILQEKRLKRWKREWKIQLIEKQNPQWKDLTEEIMG